MQKLKVALLGGSFNPTTIAHMRMGSLILNQGKADKVIYIPCGTRTDKPDLLPSEHRLNFLKIDISNSFKTPFKLINSSNRNALDLPENVLIDEFEINEFKKLMPTSWLIKKYKDTFKNVEFRLIMGSDLLNSFDTWEDFEEVLKVEDYIIFERDQTSFDLSKLPKKHDLVFDKTISRISSTDVRCIFKEGWAKGSLKDPNTEQKLMRFISPQLLEYVIDNRLYR